MDDFMALPAGRELDALVAERVMGMVPCAAWRYANLGSGGGPVSIKDRGDCSHESCYPADESLPFGGPPRFSSEIIPAWQVIEKLRHNGQQFRLLDMSVATNDPATPFILEGWRAWFRDGKTADRDREANAETAPLAISRAALLAVGAKDVQDAPNER